MSSVVIVFQRIGPYHRARLNAAADRFPTVALELTSTDSTYAWDQVDAPELDRVTVFDNYDAYSDARSKLLWHMAQVLDRIRPTAVAIPGWFDPAALAALRWCAINSTPAVAMSESQAADADRRPWKEALKRRVLQMCSAAVVGGAPHAAYLENLGMPAERIFTGYDVVDNDHFATGADSARRNDAVLRARLGVPERFFLASSRFVEKKNLFRLIDAFALFRKVVPDSRWKLVLLGDGPLKPQLMRAAAERGVVDALVFPGFQQYNELPMYYGLAAAFVHASTAEQWGLVVNEAMASGLPVLVSNRCGCAPDLVHEGVNGFTFDPGRPDNLASVMARLAADELGRGRMGAASRRIIARWPAARFASALEKAVACALSPRRLRVADALLLRILIERAA